MNVRILQTLAEVEAIAEPWKALGERARARPFQSFAWSAAWLRTLGAAPGYRIAVGTAWEGDRLVAVLPFVVTKHKGVRLLQWIGARVTDYCDALIDPAVAAAPTLKELWGAYLRAGGFDLLRLGQIRTDAVIFEFFSAA